MTNPELSQTAKSRRTPLILLGLFMCCAPVIPAWGQDISQICMGRQFMQQGAESHFSDPQFAQPLSDGTTDCHINYPGTDFAQYACTRAFEDAAMAKAYALNQVMIFRRCFQGIQFSDSGPVTDSTSGQKDDEIQSQAFADNTWIEISFDITPNTKGIYHSAFIFHSPPPQ